MFIERSAGRIRLARLTFVVVALLPCAMLAAWAFARGSAGHREAVRVRWQQSIGLPLTIGAVEHPRPGVVRAACAMMRDDAPKYARAHFSALRRILDREEPGYSR